MQWYRNLKIAKKLIIGFVIVAIIAGVVGIVGIMNIRTMDALDTEMYERHTATLPDLANIARAYQRQRVGLRNLYIDKDINKRQAYLDEIDSQRKIIEESLVNFEKGIKDLRVRDSFDKLTVALEDFKVFSDETINYINSGQMDLAYEQLVGDRAIQMGDTIQKETDNIFQLKTELAKQSSETNASTAFSSTITMIIVIAVGIFLAIILGIVIARMISKPVVKMVQAADKLAVGDVNVNVEVNTDDEIGKLAESLHYMVENIRNQAIVAERIAKGDMTVDVNVRSENDILGKALYEMVAQNNEILGNIASSSEQVAVGAKQISDSSIALSQGATEQASSVEELTASLEEISAQTKLNAQNSKQANELSVKAKDNALQGNSQMKGMLKAMEEINESSSNIYKIIKVIDDIAFQTNILALNAAVEAARAGQHGKGFAVVAEEVRTLAARSANAAKETTAMIEDSIKKAEDGTKIAKDTAEALNKIVSGIEEVANLIDNITVASEEQSLGIEQVNQGIMQVSEVVQNNSATSEEGAAASEELSSQADLLKEMVSKFKLKDHTKSKNKINELSPEVLAMLENMADKKRNKSDKANTNENNNEGHIKTQIILSDKEFGKY